MPNLAGEEGVDVPSGGGKLGLYKVPGRKFRITSYYLRPYENLRLRLDHLIMVGARAVTGGHLVARPFQVDGQEADSRVAVPDSDLGNLHGTGLAAGPRAF